MVVSEAWQPFPSGNFTDGSMTICCPRLPKDIDARIGVRRDPKNPDKKQKIFGYNLVLTTSVELQLNIELPVAVSNIAGNVEQNTLNLPFRVMFEYDARFGRLSDPRRC